LSIDLSAIPGKSGRNRLGAAKLDQRGVGIILV
jgi:hypothetical protein